MKHTYEVGDFVQTPVGKGLVASMLGSYVSVSLSDGGNYFGYTWNLYLIKAVGL